ncbi:M56 family metallopeptidase [Cyclobacterium plantarum]|uniref:Energy transducer TonB n=1 Tax=Cyclobacterium plantarum TaxID=2716263 RepID=A0ABX0HAB9_9BACT|nr:M56 family metallopeptidase [Cyclobacterium plantarum]NHE57347.1 energy transducer TonB [Cyclobacterium plantarum]
MAHLINYIWQSTFCLAFFYGLYWVFLKNEKTFLLNRIYLLVTPVLALAFPLVKIQVPFEKPNISLENTAFLKAIQTDESQEVVGTFGLPEITVTGSKLPLLWEITDYLLLGYMAIVMILFTKLLWQYFQLRQILERGWYQTRYILKENYFKVPTFGMAPVFSFFDKIFWDENEDLTENEKTQIIQHELEHVKQKHTYDVLYYQFLSILFWFNPMIHLMRFSLIDLHEYQADAYVLKETVNRESYPRLLVKMAFKGIELPIGNYFIRSTTLKRIVMMKRPHKIKWFKLLMLFPLMLMLFGLVSMKTEKGITMLNQFKTQPTYFLKNQILAAQDSIQVGIKVKNLKNPVHYESIGMLENQRLVAQLGELSYEFSGIQNENDYLRILQLIESLRNNSTLVKQYANVLPFDKVEKKPEPSKGWGNWYSYLQNQVHLPQGEFIAASDPVELEFIIDGDGKINYPVIKKSLNGLVDQQLLDAMKSPHAPQWNSGQHNGQAVAVVVHTKLYVSSNPNISSATDRKQTTPEPVKRQQAAATRDDKVNSPSANFAFANFSFAAKDTNDLKSGAIALGDAARGYLVRKLKFPFSDNKNDHIGTVLVQLRTNMTGKVIHYQILESPSAAAEKELLEVLKDIPALEPVKAKNEYLILLPVTFQLRGEEYGLPPSQKNKYGEEITVNAYADSEKNRFKPELPPLTQKLPLKIINKNYINFNGITLPLNIGLSKGIASLTRHHQWNPEKVEVELYAFDGVKMGTIQEVQKALRENGMNKIHYAEQINSELFDSSKQPLYILDGEVQTDNQLLTQTKPIDIESISVLKSNQVNLYGEKAKNGVIIITTKK